MLILFLGIWINPQKATAKRDVSYQVFYSELSPYGTWIAIPNHGYVWRPNVAPGFTPYATNGYWADTDEGWTWVSNYPWGRAPFHYGRWYTDATYGPLWIPGNVWGPGWVNWRNTNGYYIWEPMGPSFNKKYYSHNNRWMYVNGHDFGRRNNRNYYYVNASYNRMVHHNSKAINNFRKGQAPNSWYNAGPHRQEVGNFNGKKFTPFAIKQREKPSRKFNGDQFHSNKPKVNNNNYGKPNQSNAPKNNVNSSHQTFPKSPVQNTHQSNNQKQSPQSNKTQQSKPGHSNSSKGGKK